MSDELRDAFRRAQALQADLDKLGAGKPQPTAPTTQHGGRVITWQPVPDSEVTRGLAAMIAFNGLHDYADCRLCRQVPADASRHDQEQLIAERDHFDALASTQRQLAEKAQRDLEGYDQQNRQLAAENERLRAELAEAMGECIDFTISYGIGDEDRYRARYRELTGRGYHDEGGDA